MLPFSPANSPPLAHHQEGVPTQGQEIGEARQGFRPWRNRDCGIPTVVEVPAQGLHIPQPKAGRQMENPQPHQGGTQNEQTQNLGVGELQAHEGTLSPSLAGNQPKPICCSKSRDRDSSKA